MTATPLTTLSLERPVGGTWTPAEIAIVTAIPNTTSVAIVAETPNVLLCVVALAKNASTVSRQLAMKFPGVPVKWSSTKPI